MTLFFHIGRFRSFDLHFHASRVVWRLHAVFFERSIGMEGREQRRAIIPYSSECSLYRFTHSALLSESLSQSYGVKHDDEASHGAIQITTQTVTHNDNFELSVRPPAPVPVAFVKGDAGEGYGDAKRYEMGTTHSVDSKHKEIGDDDDTDPYERGDIDIEAMRPRRVIAFDPITSPTGRQN